MSTRSGQRAAWWFVAPALLVIGVFFFLPVLAALVMSLTDFDLYALNDFGDLRWIGFYFDRSNDLIRGGINSRYDAFTFTTCNPDASLSNSYVGWRVSYVNCSDDLVRLSINL